MEALTFQSLDNEWIIKIDKNRLSPEFITRMLRRLQLELLAEQAAFDKKLPDDLAESIETDWWLKHGDEFLKNVKR